MSTFRPTNSELSKMESFLDDQCTSFGGSDFYSTLESIYEELDSLISEFKESINDLTQEKEELEARLEEVE